MAVGFKFDVVFRSLSIQSMLALRAMCTGRSQLLSFESALHVCSIGC